MTNPSSSTGPTAAPHSPIHSTRLRRAVLAVSVIALAATGLTACGSSSATSTAAATVTPAAVMHTVSNHGHRLAFYVTSGHQPAIVLDAGGGNDSTYWKKLVPSLSRLTGSEVITYDRAGMGNSEYVPGPIQGKDAASDLAAGLEQLHITHGAVLVAHAEAGEVATNFVDEYPGVVSGAVLVDATVPEFYTPEETARIVAAEAPQVAAAKKQKPTKAGRQLIAEAENYGPEHLAYNTMSWPPNVPAIAIVSASTPFPTALDAQRWRQAQSEFVDAAPNRRLVTAAHSSHDIPLDRQQLVVDEIQDMVKKLH